ncbi:MAG TPA: glycosyltransferase family 1 protein [Chthonomonadales bacterium]|nr:glycosyltransferase family 1 protein [Chthonomonadales bacterium]
MRRDRLRVGIDARALCGRFTGDRTYWLHLIAALLQRAERGEDGCPDYHLYTRMPIPDGLLSVASSVIVHVVPSANDRLWTLVAWPRALRAAGIDVAHTQYTVPVRPPCPVVTTIHDISFRLHPPWFPLRDRLLLNLTVPIALRQASRVLTVSESSRRDILRTYRCATGTVVATPLAAGPAYQPVLQETARALVKERWSLADPYLLSVGVLQPRKNLGLLVEAYARARQDYGLTAPLVLTGKRGWGYESLVGAVSRLGIGPHVVLTDYVHDEDMPALYSAASALAYPSLYEGFGLPPLEAMACGCPALVSDAPAMPEVAGEAGWVLPAREPGPWAQAMASISSDAALRQVWSARGRRRSGDFRWDRTAALTAQVYADAVAGRASSTSVQGGR